MTRPLPDAIAALERGDLIDAIKRTREATGLGLKESKELVERYANGDADVQAVGAADDFDALLHGRPTPASALPAVARAALQRGQVIEAIKLTREATGLGLKEAKDLVDAARTADGSVPGLASAGATFDPLHEPGRVRSGGSRAALVVVVLLGLLLAWWLFGR
ncbi:MAG: ribosomal protein L7/L12 [Proteobacteria bacterium]|nr:ribosomal protein L7/L12 [Pseudomonadota bacterium]